ncbi:MAG: aKG-HExxH-type peptide beta-hydroxylase [Pseudonocardiaceae bacterium]
MDPDVIDSPLTRHLIGEALAGHADLTRSTLGSLCAMAGAETDGTQGLRVASRPEANTLLAEALGTIQAQVLLQQTLPQPLRLLTEPDGARFIAALSILRNGITLARSINSELVDDLFTHITLVAIFDQWRSCGLASGSSRNFPGLVLLSEPLSDIEVAEALVHEGAHQKFFDLAITHDLFNADADQCPPFHPPWSSKEIPWPLEQTLAAYHAYACLAQFADDAGVPVGTRALGTDSLFPVAGERSNVLGQWLLDRGDHLGADACTLLAGLIGRCPRASAPVGGSAPSMPRSYVIDTPLEFRRCDPSGRVLVGRPTRPPQLYWVTRDAAALLTLIPQMSLHDIIQSFTLRWRIPPADTAERITSLLSDLIASGLLTARDTTE